jgi:hypothetical protein
MFNFLMNLDNELNNQKRNRSWLAKELNTNPSTINTWYLNNRPPRLDIAYKIANALKGDGVNCASFYPVLNRFTLLQIVSYNSRLLRGRS